MNRRLLLERIVQGFTATGLLAFLYPFIKAGLPNRDGELGLDVDVGDLAPGQHKVVDWRGRRVYVRRREESVLDLLTGAPARLKDPQSSQSVQPGFAQNAWRSRQPEIFVAFTNCTHLGCEVDPVSERDVGFKCPCHQSDYDHAGRVVTGAAAPTNLEIPNYRFVTRRTLRLEAETT